MNEIDGKHTIKRVSLSQKLFSLKRLNKIDKSLRDLAKKDLKQA